jgi:hypothetical protein
LLLHVYNINLTDVEKPAAGIRKAKSGKTLGVRSFYNGNLKVIYEQAAGVIR